MKHGRLMRWLAGMLLSAHLTLPLARADLWCTGYYPGYAVSRLPIAELDFSVLTHIVHFSLLPDADGSLDANTHNISPEATLNLVTAAHAAKKQAIICVGGAGSYFPNAASANNVSNFVSNLTNFMARGNYDGIDVDWEPLPPEDETLYTNLLIRLRRALDGFSSHKLLISAVPSSASPAMVAAIQNQLDQVNLMTYDLSGPYPGWITWHNGPIYDGGYTFPSAPGQLLPSIDGCVKTFTTAGVPAHKLGVGVAFYGYVWAGGSDGSGNGMMNPRQSWMAAPAVYTRTYTDLMSSNFPSAAFHYDTVAQAAWIGVNGSGNNDMFISFDDARACQSKVSYARNHGLGGLIIWELTQDHSPGRTDPLLQAIRQALATPGNLSINDEDSAVTLSFASAPLGAYRVQWTTNLTAGPWDSLAITNLSLSATGGMVQVSDPDGSTTPLRFYRVRSPP